LVGEARESARGAAPNRFDDTVRTVDVGADGSLVLRVRRDGDNWRCSFDWSPHRVTFRAAGVRPWVLEGDDVPTPDSAHRRINLWLYEGVGPPVSRDVAVTIQRFRFVPRLPDYSDG
jgi:hypothetical protein